MLLVPMDSHCPSSQDGGVTEEEFEAAMYNTEAIPVMSVRHLDGELAKIKSMLSNTNEDWEKRVDALKTLRGLAIGGACESPGFRDSLKALTVG